MSKRKVFDLAPGVRADTHIHSGAPCISGRRISTAWIAGRWGAGESLQSIAEDYEDTEENIEAALRYEFRRLRDRIPEMVATAEGMKVARSYWARRKVMV